jgi:hypothetical protein
VRGRAFADGVLRQLFDDLDTQESAEAARLHPPLQETYDARNALIQLYGYKPQVKATDKPYLGTWSTGDRDRFMNSLLHDDSKKVDDAVNSLFLAAGEDESLALACICRLITRGYQESIKMYCQQRIRTGGPYTEEFRAVLRRLEARKHGYARYHDKKAT